MNSVDLVNTWYDAHKKVVFEINEIGYLINDKENLFYSTFFQKESVSSLLNNTARIILLTFNGKRTLEEVLETSYNIFEGVSKQLYFLDFIEVVNKLIRIGILISQTEKERYCKIQENKSVAFKANFQKIKKKYDFFS